MSRTYKGWIPTVSGRLSFDVIGTGSHPSPPDCMNIADRETRFVLCKQERILLDNALPFQEKSALYFYKEIGRFVFVCVAKSSNNITDEIAPLSGYVLIFESSSWNEVIHKKFKSFQLDLHDYWNVRGSQSLEAFFSSKYEEILCFLMQDSYFFVPFDLQRNGITVLEIEEEYSGRNDAPLINEAERHLEHTVCSQAFFFLKDIIHNHQHHDPYTDTLSDIYLVNDQKDEYRWGCEALRLLYRTILTFKRNRREDVCNSALGVIAYAQSFKGIINEELATNQFYTDHNKKLSPDLNDPLLIQSIHASQESQRHYIQNKIRKHDKFTNIILGFLTVVLSIVGMLQITKISYEQDDVSIIFHFLSWSIITQPILCLTGLLLFGFFIAERSGVFAFKRRTNLYRVIVTQDQKKAELGLYFIGIFVLLLAILVSTYLDKIANVFK